MASSESSLYRLAFAHKARVGKDTACDYIRSQVRDCEIVRFAETIYSITNDIQQLYQDRQPTSVKTYELYEVFIKYLGIYILSQNTTLEVLRWTDLQLKPEILKRGPLNNRGIKTPWLLQFIGAGFRTILGKNIWVNIAREKIMDLTQDGKNICVPDLRFKNEAAMLREFKFTLIDIDRPNRPIDRNVNDISEIDLDGYPFDMTIMNDLTLDDFYNKLRANVLGITIHIT